MTLTISSKGWVVIPAEIRKKYNLRPGSKVELVDYGGVIALVPLYEDPVNQGYGLLRDGSSLTQALIEERKLNYAREEREDVRLKS